MRTFGSCFHNMTLLNTNSNTKKRRYALKCIYLFTNKHNSQWDNAQFKNGIDNKTLNKSHQSCQGYSQNRSIQTVNWRFGHIERTTIITDAHKKNMFFPELPYLTRSCCFLVVYSSVPGKFSRCQAQLLVSLHCLLVSSANRFDGIKQKFSN